MAREKWFENRPLILGLGSVVLALTALMQLHLAHSSNGAAVEPSTSPPPNPQAPPPPMLPEPFPVPSTHVNEVPSFPNVTFVTKPPVFKSKPKPPSAIVEPTILIPGTGTNVLLGNPAFKVPPPPVPALGSQPKQAAVRDEMEGKILFNPPVRMKQGEEDPITVRIAGNRTIDITSGLPQRPTPTIEPIIVMPYMTVKLFGGESFKVDKLTPENQFVKEDDFSEWKFKVKALKAGKHELDLEVGVRVKTATGTDEYSFKPTYEREINIDVDRRYAIMAFLKENFTAIASATATIVVGAIGFVIKYFFFGGKKESDGPTPDTDRV
jgi:hypothetical protein